MSDSKPRREQLSQGTAHVALEAASQAAGTARDQIKKATDTAADTTKRVAEGGRDVMMSGAQAAADIGGRFGDIGTERGHRLLSSFAQMADIYRGTSERSAGHVQSLMTSYLAVGRGLQQMQHAWLDLLDQAIEHAAHKPQDLLRCRSLAELAEVQRDMFLDTVNYAVTAQAELLRLANRTTQEVARPLDSGAQRQ